MQNLSHCIWLFLIGGGWVYVVSVYWEVDSRYNTIFDKNTVYISLISMDIINDKICDEWWYTMLLSIKRAIQL